jgi:hypothetical protein
LNGREGRAEASAGLQRALKPLDRAEFASALEDLLVQLNAGKSDRSAPWPPFRILTSEQIRRMSREGLVRFGAHTATHQILTRTSPVDARQEIERSVGAVAGLVQHPSRSFAYPNGGADDFNPAVVEAVRGAGIEFAVSTIPGPAGRDTNPYAIPRYHVGDDPLARFASLVHHARHAVGEIRRTVTGAS